ncbi:hypothetical protein B1R32_12229 [Abditibacterium utsteinense]|uniref:Uncharacterized protein n=1 Tax=Abditibacterium utsteinense TaxID=1960156 RepID=A0A2S8SPQ7_9BACT|nr:DUF6263 family protein [Abditibacterium utsteinense]PQV62782.1 hypothetical protein B1R32_12229 [Abditibacterium utsteinense]
MKPWLFVALATSFGTAFGTSAPLWAQDAPATVVGATPFNWQIRLRAGQKFRTTLNTSAKMTMAMPMLPAAPGKVATKVPAPIETNSTSRTVFEQNVLSSDEKGARIELIYRESTQKIVTGNEPANEATKIASDTFKNMVGARLIYTLSPQGKVSDLQGVDEYVARMIGGANENQSEEQRKIDNMMRESMQKALSREALESMFEKSSGNLPTAPVALGESWKTKIEMPVIMGIKVGDTGTRTFAGREGDLVVISENSVIENDPNTKLDFPLPTNPDKTIPAPTAKFAMKGVSQGETKVDEKTGMVRSRRSNQKTNVTATMENIDGKGGKMEMTMDMTDESTSTTELLPETLTN